MGSRQKMENFKPAAQRQSATLDYVRNLLDAESFVEQDSYLSSSGTALFAREAVAGDGLVSGYGSIAGQPVYLAAQDRTVFKGAVGKIHAEKFARACEQATAAGYPFIAVLDSGGVRAEEGLLALHGLSSILIAMKNAAYLIPLLVIVKGPLAGALSMALNFASAVIIAGDEGGVFLQGPGVTLATEDSELQPRDLGGADVLARRSGNVSLKAKDAADAAALLKKLLSYRLPQGEWSDDPNRSATALNEMAANLDSGVRMQDVLEAVFDSGSLLPTYVDYATELYCAFARIAGRPVAVLAQDGKALGLASAAKLQRFLRLAEDFTLPLLSFTHGSGFVSGSAAEQEGVAITAAELCEAFMNYAQPRINIYIGKAHGIHLLSFNSKYLGCDYAYAWPTVELGLLNADQALALFGAKDLEASSDPIGERPRLLERYSEQYNALSDATAAGLIDEIIMPEATRPYIYQALQALGAAD